MKVEWVAINWTLEISKLSRLLRCLCPKSFVKNCSRKIQKVLLGWRTHLDTNKTLTSVCYYDTTDQHALDRVLLISSSLTGCLTHIVYAPQMAQPSSGSTYLCEVSRKLMT